MKKITILILTLALLFSVMNVWAEGGQEEKEAASAEPVVLRLAETHAQDYPTTKGDYEFARLVEERTDGRIKIEVYHSSQLGEERAVIEQVQFGAIDFTRVSISPLSAFVPEFDALQMPFLYRSADHMWKVLEGDIGKEFFKNLETSESGFVGLTWYDSGARSFYNSKKVINTVDDVKGLKIRVQEAPLMMKLVELMGGVPTPMPFGEVYSALQTGVIDGAENNWPSYFSTSHYEVAEFYTLDGHTRVPEITIASKISMDKLSRADQEIIKQAAWDSMGYQKEQWAAYEKEAESKIKAAGNTITIPTPEAVKGFQEAMLPLYDEQPDYVREMIKKIQAVK